MKPRLNRSVASLRKVNLLGALVLFVLGSLCALGSSGITRSGSDVTISFDAASGSSYRLERKLNLSDAMWNAITGLNDLNASSNGVASITDPGAIGLGQAFYRVAVVLPLTVTTSGNGTGGITSSPDGIDCGATCSANFDANSSVTLTATADSTSNFTGWSGACSGTGTCLVTMNASKSAIATFALNQFTLSVTNGGNGSGSVTSNPSGINCGSTCSAQFNANTMITLTATAGGGSSFAGWGGACSGTGTCQVTMDAAKSVTATFQLNQPTLTVNKNGNGSGTVTSNPAGINCGATCSASYNFGTVVTLAASAAAGSTFSGWTGGGCSGTGTCTVTLTASTSVTATFSQ